MRSNINVDRSYNCVEGDTRMAADTFTKATPEASNNELAITNTIEAPPQ